MWPFKSSYPVKALAELKSHYDFIVVGGGTGGCLLARRLSEDPRFSVLLVERGDASNSFLDTTPLLSMHHLSTGKHSTVFDSVPDSRLGRSWTLITGLGLGGTSRINANIYTCGVPAQYNAWHAQGRDGWSYDEMKPYFMRSQNWTGPVPQEDHGVDGPLDVRSFEAYTHGCSLRAAEAARKIGFRQTVDVNSPFEPSTGVNKVQYTLDASGRRHSSFRAFLPADVVANRPNLHVCCGVIATKLEISNGNDNTLSAEAVELQRFSGGSAKRVITARREIVLCCGALRTPQLLLLSGVGPQEHLREVGIPVVKHAPGVGNHLQDHILVQSSFNCPMADSLYSVFRQPLTLLRELYNYLRHGTGALQCFMVETEIFSLSSVISADGTPTALSAEQQDPYSPDNVPDICVMISTVGDPRRPGTDHLKGTMGIDAGLMLAKSTGHLRLRSRDPRAQPICDMRYATSPDDRKALRAALRVTAAMAEQLRVDGYPLEAVHAPDTTSDVALDEYIDENVETMYHYSSTCRMAPEEDECPGVIDDKLRVHGIRKLRIADASVFPNCPAAHPQAVVYAFAGKCADLMLRS
ncbi:GMC oxidoreductase-domain-containing protein [Fomitopsis serialis]|uniref:GMC oxidoreductase-domain-containing protein n=1 Tax=Fomitopsis serialis TaxID=139415 RepID=UPI0020088D6A|nr:GMC oxidoreductase-domain-containing protein [Neoantrodia serialis]KAH9930084.1 GMC oxidoreductase-domain-containing protein [Neoantrodia serialis]